MSSDIIMDYTMVADMKAACAKVREELETAISEVSSIADTLEGGGLIGAGGTSFSNALRGSLQNKISVLRDQIQEVEDGLQAAMIDMQTADNTAKQDIQ